MIALAGLAFRSVTDYLVRNATEMNMRLEELQFNDPVFTQPDAVRFTRVNAATLDNWLRYEHVRTVRDDRGARVFAFSDLLAVDCIEMLTAMFKMPPKIAAAFASRAVAQYEDGFSSDRTSLAVGSPAQSNVRDLDAHFTFAREGAAVIEVGEDRPDSVMLVLPTRVIARQLLSRIQDAELDDTETAR